MKIALIVLAAIVLTGCASKPTPVPPPPALHSSATVIQIVKGN